MNLMRSYVGKRLLQLVFVLFGVTFLTYIVTAAAPGDGAEMYYLSRGFTPSQELLKQTREDMGLHDPLLIRYGRWLKNALKGELGVSYSSGEHVLTQLGRRLPGTLRLAGTAFVLMVFLAFPLGILTAVYKNSSMDYVVRFVTFFGNAMPDFWVALILMFILAVKLKCPRAMGTTDLKSIVTPAPTPASSAEETTTKTI